MFGVMVSHPDTGESFIREILQIIFKKSFERLVVRPQKVYYGSNTDKHGARLDVYLEEVDDAVPGGAIVYDVEPDQNEDEESKAALPKRTRFYHAKIDAQSLKSGEHYRSLKNVIVILITPYDPFGLNRMVYTIRCQCVESPEMNYDDGACTMYLYTKGTEGNPPEELKQLLHYMENTKVENANSEALQNIDRMVNRIKMDGEVSLEYMKIFEREEMLIRKGQEMERQNTEREKQRADTAEQRADTAEQRADTAEQRAARAEQEVEALRKELRILKGREEKSQARN